MKVTLISFGKISEFIHNQELEIGPINNTDLLKTHLEQVFPNLAGIKYKLAINKVMVQSPQKLSEEDVIAIMPPFSGG